MEHTVSGVVDKPADAQRIIDELIAHCLCDRSDISLMAGDQPGQGSSTLARAARVTGQVATAAGNAVAATLGGVMGAASAVVSRPVSGVGVLSVFGQLAAMLSRTALTTVEDVAKALIGFGVAAELARDHAEALQRGAIVIVVHAKTGNMATCVRQTMASHGAVAQERTAQ